MRGKKIPLPADGIRPTGDKMRGQIFDLIDQHFRHADGRARLPGAITLDAFAGTGALGLEALSRGARHLTAWDTNARAVAALNTIARDLAFDGLYTAVQSALSPPMARVAADLIFLDPPYAKGLVARAVVALRQSGWIGPETLLIIEAESSLAVPEGIKLRAQKTTGISSLLIGTI